MEVELLFRRNPLVQQDGAGMKLIEPNHPETLELPGRTHVLSLRIPEQLKGANMLMEVVWEIDSESIDSYEFY